MFIDNEVDIDRAIDVVLDAKLNKANNPHAIDVLIIHSKIAQQVLLKLAPLLAQASVVVYGDRYCYTALRKCYPKQLLKIAQVNSFSTHWKRLAIGVRVLSHVGQAIAYVSQNTSGYAETIMTTNHEHAKQFADSVDAAVVYVNASPQFTNSMDFGLGGQMGVTNGKIHARGPITLENLTTYKWLAEGKWSIQN